MVVILGKRRSGKSYYLKTFFIPLLLSLHLQYVIWDYNHEYQIMSKKSVIVNSVNEVLTAYLTGVEYIIYQPFDKSEKNFNLFCSVVYNEMVEVICIIEEVNRYATSHKIPYWLKQIVDTGRHLGIGLVVTSRRIKGLHADITANANHIIVFRTTQIADLDEISKMIGDEVKALPKLKSYSYFYYNDYTGETVAKPPL